MESKYDLGNILQPNVELHQAKKEEPNGLVVGNDPKTAFLTELKELMDVYDVKIRQDSNFGIMSIYIGDEELKYKEEVITPSNIFDYDK